MEREPAKKGRNRNKNNERVRSRKNAQSSAVVELPDRNRSCFLYFLQKKQSDEVARNDEEDPDTQIGDVTDAIPNGHVVVEAQCPSEVPTQHEQDGNRAQTIEARNAFQEITLCESQPCSAPNPQRLCSTTQLPLSGRSSSRFIFPKSHAWK